METEAGRAAGSAAGPLPQRDEQAPPPLTAPLVALRSELVAVVVASAIAASACCVWVALTAPTDADWWTAGILGVYMIGLQAFGSRPLRRKRPPLSRPAGAVVQPFGRRKLAVHVAGALSLVALAYVVFGTDDHGDSRPILAGICVGTVLGVGISLLRLLRWERTHGMRLYRARVKAFSGRTPAARARYAF